MSLCFSPASEQERIRLFALRHSKVVVPAPKREMNITQRSSWNPIFYALAAPIVGDSCAVHHNKAPQLRFLMWKSKFLPKQAVAKYSRTAALA